MSFVSELRMRNMFPVHSNMGTAQIDLSGPDPMEEIIQRALQLRGTQQPRETGLQQVAQQQRQNTGDTNIGIGGRRLQPGSTLEEPLVFGGVRGEQSNPGADILRRATGNAERLYNSYSQTAPAPKGPSNDEQHLENYFKRQNEEKKADAALEAAGGKGWKTVNVTDPNDPSKTTAVQVRDSTGEVRPLDVNGVLTNKTTPQQLEKMNKEKEANAIARENVKTRAQSSLDLLHELYDPKTDSLTNEGLWAAGGSSIVGSIPLPTEAAAGTAKLQQLASQRVLSLIEEMKKQSSTGATGMGNMSNRDLSVLQDAASLLSKPHLPEATIKEQLKLVEQVLNRALQDRPNTTGQSTQPGQTGSNNSPLGAGAQGGKIKVRDKATGKVGTMSEGAFNPQKYDKVQ